MPRPCKNGSICLELTTDFLPIFKICTALVTIGAVLLLFYKKNYVVAHVDLNGSLVIGINMNLNQRAVKTFLTSSF